MTELAFYVDVALQQAYTAAKNYQQAVSERLIPAHNTYQRFSNDIIECHDHSVVVVKTLLMANSYASWVYYWADSVNITALRNTKF